MAIVCTGPQNEHWPLNRKLELIDEKKKKCRTSWFIRQNKSMVYIWVRSYIRKVGIYNKGGQILIT